MQLEPYYFPEINITHGFAPITESFVSIQMGISTKLTVQKEINTVSLQNLMRLLKKEKVDFLFDFSLLNEVLFDNAFELMEWVIDTLSFKDVKRVYKNQKSIWEIQDNYEQDFFNHLFLLPKSKKKIVGAVQVAGNSFIPVQPVCFIECFNISLKNEEKISIVNLNNLVVGDREGYTKYVTGKIVEPFKLI